MVPNFQRRYQVSSNTLFSLRKLPTGTLSLLLQGLRVHDYFIKTFIFIYGPAAPLVGPPFPDRDQTHAPCIGSVES